MELSVLLAEQIVVIFLMMAIGYVIVKIRLFKTEDSSVLSIWWCIYVSLCDHQFLSD